MAIYCNNPQCRGVLNERTPSRCPECGVATGAEPRNRIDLLEAIPPYSTDRPPPSAEAQAASQEVLAVMEDKLADLRPAVRVGRIQPCEMIMAIGQWLQFGEDMFNDGHQQGYFCGDGWAARALRAARDFIEKADRA